MHQGVSSTEPASTRRRTSGAASRWLPLVGLLSSPWLVHCNTYGIELEAGASPVGEAADGGLAAAVGDALAPSDTSNARCTAPTIDPETELTSFFENHGGKKAFSNVSVDALSTFVRAEALYFQCEYGKAKELLDSLWQRYPVGSNVWDQATSSVAKSNLGSPTAYYGLRMLTDAVAYRLAPAQGIKPSKLVMTVVIVSCSEGIEPRSNAELTNSTGVLVKHALDPALAPGTFDPILDSSVRLFREYVTAMTDGRLELEPRVHRLANFCVSVETKAAPYRVAGIADQDSVWSEVPDSIKDSTDFWWTIYPSHVPEQYPDFTNVEFITGGMGGGPDGQSPNFIVDDRWLVRRPPHMGQGKYTDVERRAYRPQWLQHEFYHHVFSTYPEFELEVTSHQWFDPNSWPSDFQGRYEADYYAESLHKRLKSAQTPLSVRLRYSRVAEVEVLSKMNVGDLVGSYERSPVENGYHQVTVENSASGLVWRNAAGLSWKLTPDLGAGKLHTGPDCPYYSDSTGKNAVVRLKLDEHGTPTPVVEGLQFGGET